MSNLGAYQIMTTLAKKVHGPVALGAIFFVGGYAVIRTAEGGIRTVAKKSSANKIANKYKNKTFTVTKSETDKQGLSFKSGDKFKVLETDGDAILVELLGNDNNPYFVASSFLHDVSDFA